MDDDASSSPPSKRTGCPSLFCVAIACTLLSFLLLRPIFWKLTGVWETINEKGLSLRAFIGNSGTQALQGDGGEAVETVQTSDKTDNQNSGPRLSGIHTEWGGNEAFLHAELEIAKDLEQEEGKRKDAFDMRRSKQRVGKKGVMKRQWKHKSREQVLEEHEKARKRKMLIRQKLLKEEATARTAALKFVTEGIERAT
eukprot:TRINITY_DN1177_c0_g1_i1.p1 TRINITY_DN1177_c0_g1~~TRINITY_DN1177_c0_g1_i1.p1  ORF type:complete len:197 (-),score=49.29 TRINITY_DN1177_c0_g1_i1:155-745(-)